jgi:hypothetical protein
LGALSEGLMAAKVAIQTRHMMMQGDTVADSEALDRVPGPNFYNGSGRFMPKNARRWNRAVLDFFDVGRANTARGHPDEEFVPANARHGDGFEAQVVRTAIHGGAHVFWDREHGELLTQRRGGAKERVL